MNIKYLLKRIAVFTVIPILPIYFLSKYDNMDRQYNQDNNVASLQNKSKFDSLDILFIGNSYCYSGIIPAYFDNIGLKTYNLGIATAGPYFYEVLINDYLSNCKKKPKSIYLLISPTTFSSMADNFLAYPIHRYIDNNISNEQVSLKFGLYSTYLEMLQKSIKKGYKNITTKNCNIEKNEDLFEAKGFYKMTDTCTNETITNTEKLYLPLVKDVFSSKKLEYLANYAKELKLRNIEVVFFDLPTYKLKNYLNPVFIADYNAAKENIKKQFKFVSTDSSISGNYFRNIDHLNFNGAKWVTKKMVSNIPIVIK